MNNIEKQIIDKLTVLVGDLLRAAQDDKNNARRYTRTRMMVEKALKQISIGYRSTLERPTSIGLPQHELKVKEEPEPLQPVGDLLADNLPDVDDEPLRKTRKRVAK